MFKTPLVDHSNNIHNIDHNNINNIVLLEQTDKVANLSKKNNLFRDEELQLECEWDDCSDYCDHVTQFTQHVSAHVSEAEIRQLGT